MKNNKKLNLILSAKFKGKLKGVRKGFYYHLLIEKNMVGIYNLMITPNKKIATLYYNSIHDFLQDWDEITFKTKTKSNA